jgi:hypothetical protein
MWLELSYIPFLPRPGFFRLKDSTNNIYCSGPGKITPEVLEYFRWRRIGFLADQNLNFWGS